MEPAKTAKVQIPGHPSNTRFPIIDSICRHRKIQIDTKQQSLTFPAFVNMEKGEIEVLLCRKEGKIHESIFTTDITPEELHLLLLFIGLQPALESPTHFTLESFLTFLQKEVYRTDKEAIIWISWTDLSGVGHKIRAENFLINRDSQTPLKKKCWFFSGLKTDNRGKHSDYSISLASTLIDPFDIMTISGPEAWQNNLLWMNETYHLQEGQIVNITIERKKKRK